MSSADLWPIGPEVRRLTLPGGAMLYDTSRVSNFTAVWFEASYWAERGEIESTARGRGTVQMIRSGDRHWVLRHYHRGGLVARVLKDRYLWQGEAATRPFREWRLLYQLHRAGLPVPAPIGARYCRQGLMYSGDLITERLLGTESLAAKLVSSPLPEATWAAVGHCIRRFHDAGVFHADLNAHNILLGPQEEVHLIDFDRGQLRKLGMWCDSNLVRLRRSLEKITQGVPVDRFSEAQWRVLLDGYHQH